MVERCLFPGEECGSLLRESDPSSPRGRLKRRGLSLFGRQGVDWEGWGNRVVGYVGVRSRGDPFWVRMTT